MPEKEITIDTGEGQMNTFIVHPDEDGPHPVILFFDGRSGKERRTPPNGEKNCCLWILGHAAKSLLSSCNRICFRWNR